MSTHTILYAYLYRHVDNIYSMSGDWIVYIINEYAFFLTMLRVVCGIRDQTQDLCRESTES